VRVFGGSQWRPFIHVSDVARAIVNVLNSPIHKVDREIFNVGDNNLNTTIEHLAYLISEIVHNDINGKSVKVFINKSLEDTRNYNVSFDKIKSKLNFESSVDLKEGISEVHKNLKNMTYINAYSDPIYNNYETTKQIYEEFLSKNYRKKHFSIISP
jgi:nucleoside-diphosphate-sugar epimerase